MPIISEIGRRSLKVRLLIGSIYILLIIGSITMVHPFILMIAGSTKSAVDTPEAKLIPEFIINDEALYQKETEALFNDDFRIMKQVYHTEDFISFRMMSIPTASNDALVDEWEAYLKQRELLPYVANMGHFTSTVGTTPRNLRALKATYIESYKDIDSINDHFDVEFVSWNYFKIYPGRYLGRNQKYYKTPFLDSTHAFSLTLPKHDLFFFSLEGFYKNEFLKTQYSMEIDSYNASHGTSYKSYNSLHLDRTFPSGEGRTKKEQEDWNDFVRNLFNLLWIRSDQTAAEGYRDFLMAKYGTMKNLNNSYGTSYEKPADIVYPEQCPVSGSSASDWESYLQGWKDPETATIYEMPIKSISITGTDFWFQDFLKSKYGSLEKVNQACATSFSSFSDITPPQRDWHYRHFLKNRSSIKKEFMFRNLITVFDFVVIHGRAIFNTAFYCALAILTALIVNPLAAYALSRYKPPSQYKMLLFLMMTMAFPPMVTQIPIFLMIREFQMLNTFWALILPGVANGYAIFLLKGFFDSLPRELYESAEIDGASEFRIFWQFTMALSKPILAVIALQTFTGAYGNFMMALLICQDEKMWTIMPWLYQLQMNSGEGVVFASLILASVPTFLIFVFCQNIIMRGIVVPSEK